MHRQRENEHAKTNRERESREFDWRIYDIRFSKYDSVWLDKKGDMGKGSWIEKTIFFL